MRSSIVALVVSCALVFTLSLRAQQSGSAVTNGQHVVTTPTDIMWGAAPPSLPKGAQLAVLEGDPAKNGPFTMRLKVPGNYKIPPHYHPAVEHVTVVSGRLHIGMGDKWDESKGKAMPAGSFAMMPAKMHHFAWASEDTVIQLHGIGPWGITYVNPADDPSKK